MTRSTSWRSGSRSGRASACAPASRRSGTTSWAAESLDLARDLLASARDHQQARIAHEQNEVVKKLTATASLLLVPTFVVGVYGQNFEHLPEFGWGLGYGFSWAVIIVSTLAQLAFFRWKGWL